jgi:hypothetical protein
MSDQAVIPVSRLLDERGLSAPHLKAGAARHPPVILLRMRGSERSQHSYVPMGVRAWSSAHCGCRKPFGNASHT